jgi:hypothetical protein
MTKKLTLQQIHDLTNIPTPTIRAWLLKAEPGQVYTGCNLSNFHAQLAKHYTKLDEQTKIFGCAINDIEIEKNVRTHKEYIRLDDLEVDHVYNIHNYSLITTLTLKKVEKIDDDKVYIFVNEKGYKAYSVDELVKPNIRIEEVED